MDTLLEFEIPVSGLKIGTHSFDFQLDSAFFKAFEDSLVEQGEFKVQLVFEKRIDLYELNFFFEGIIKAACDRCLANIDFPIKGKNKLIVKFADVYRDEVEVIYIPIKTEKLNVAKYIHEYICLAVPFVKTYDCEAEEEKPCDEKVLALLAEKERAERSESKTNPVWDSLKNIKFN